MTNSSLQRRLTLIILTRTNAVFVLSFSRSPPKLKGRRGVGERVLPLPPLPPLLLLYIVLSNVDALRHTFGSCVMMLSFFALAVLSFLASSPPHLDH